MEINIRLARPEDKEPLLKMVNDVYYTSEKDFWTEGYYRLDEAGYDEYVKNKWLYVSYLNDNLCGCVLLKPFELNSLSFSMLVCHPGYRKQGVGSTLVDYVLSQAQKRGKEAMYLEILSPVDWIHEEKVFLKKWYEGMGFELVKEVPFADYYPDHIKFMKTDLVFSLYRLKLN